MALDDKVEGKLQQAGGKIKEGVGRHTGNPSLEAEGHKDQAAGKAKELVGEVKDVVEKGKDAVQDLK